MDSERKLNCMRDILEILVEKNILVSFVLNWNITTVIFITCVLWWRQSELIQRHDDDDDFDDDDDYDRGGNDDFDDDEDEGGPKWSGDMEAHQLAD